jgi:hypothetical protein
VNIYANKIVFFLLLVVLLSCTGLQLAGVPPEIKHYCGQISGSTNAINETMKTCIQYEQEAKKELLKMSIPFEVAKYCRDLSESTGGSYQVMKTCVIQNMSSSPE